MIADASRRPRIHKSILKAPGKRSIDRDNVLEAYRSVLIRLASTKIVFEKYYSGGFLEGWTIVLW